MKDVASYNKLTWIDITNPTTNDVQELFDQYPFLDGNLADELFVPTPRPKVEVYDDYVYLVLHFPDMNDSNGIDTRDEREIDFIIFKEGLITVHYTDVGTLFEFKKALEVNSLMNKDNFGDHGWELFYNLIQYFYHNVDAQLENIAVALKGVETRIYEGDETRMVKILSKLNRRLLEHKRSLRFHNLTMSELDRQSKKIFKGKFVSDIDRMIRQYHQLMAILDSEKEILEDLEDTNVVLLNTKTNNIMKIITILGFVIAPTIVALEILRYPLEQIVHTWQSTVITIGLSLLTSLLLWYYFQQRKDF